MKEVTLNNDAPKRLASFIGRKGVEVYNRCGVTCIKFGNEIITLPSIFVSSYEEESKMDKKLLPIGTELELVKKPFATRNFETGIKGKVIDADELHVYISTKNNGYFSLNKMDVEENWKVINDSKWDEAWRYHLPLNVFYKTNGRKIKVKHNGEIGYARCSDEDMFDLYKGIKIAKRRAELKYFEKKQDKEIEDYNETSRKLQSIVSEINVTKAKVNEVERELSVLTR